MSSGKGFSFFGGNRNSQKPKTKVGATLSNLSFSQSVKPEADTSDDCGTPVILSQYKYESEFKIPEGPYAPLDSPDNLIFEEQAQEGGMPMIKAGTVEKLVERVTFEGYPDVKYMTQFLLTYRSFITAPELLMLLSERCNLPAPVGLTEEEDIKFKNKVQKPVRLRVLNIIKTWVNQYTLDFIDDATFSDDFILFLEALSKFDGMAATVKLSLQLKKNIKLGGVSGKKREVTQREDPPKSITPKFKDSGANILDMSPIELARQLTIIESEFYRNIKPWEFLNQAWAKKGGSSAPNVLIMIHWSTRVSGFVATEIMKAPMNKKIRVIEFFMKVAHALQALNNFNAMMEIIAGFENAAVWRLQPIFAEVPRKSTQMMDDLRLTMSTEKNNKAIRESLKTCTSVSIPYLGMFLTDLTFIEDGNPDLIKGGLVNFTKRRFVATVIQEIQNYQQLPYNLNSVPVIQSYIRNSILWDDEKLYQMSLLFMPRSAKDKSVKELEVLYLEKEKELKAQRKRELEEEVDWGPLEDIPGGYAFSDPDTPNENIIFDDRGMLIAATLPKLVQRLTGRPIPGFMETFLVTWPTFCTPDEFSHLLLMRFNPPNPKNEKKLEEYKKDVRSGRTRVVGVLKTFVKNFFFHFQESKTLVQIFAPLFQKLIPTADNLTKTIESIEKSLISLAEDDASKKIEKPILKGKPFHGLQDIPDFAQQLTLIHHEIFMSLRPQCLLSLQVDGGGNVVCKDPQWLDALNEFLGQWVRAEKFVYEMVVSQVVAGTNPADRAASLEKFIAVGDACCSWHDYTTTIWILNGLMSKTLRRLPLSWSAVSHGHREKFKKMQLQVKEMVNVHTFRERMFFECSGKPGLPAMSSYFFNYIARLEMDDLLGKGLINFAKREGMASLIQDIMKLQKLSYDFMKNPEAERHFGFQQKKLIMKGDVINSCAIVMKDERASGHDIEGLFSQFIPAENIATYHNFANGFLKNHTLFENMF